MQLGCWGARGVHQDAGNPGMEPERKQEIVRWVGQCANNQL